MAKYNAQIAMAAALITKKGKSITILRPGRTLTDPVTQAATLADPTAYVANAVGLPPGRSAEFKIGSLANRRVIQFYIALRGLAITPQPGDEIAWGGNTYKVIWVETYDPADDGAIISIAYGELGPQ